MIKETGSIEEKGLLLHLLADTYAHSKIGDDGKLYATGAGHLSDGKDPDLIHKRPEIYGKFVVNLANSLNPSLEKGSEAINEIKQELLGATERATDRATFTDRTGQASRYNGKIDDGKASDYSIEEMRALVKKEGEKQGDSFVLDKPEDHSLNHAIQRTPEGNIDNFNRLANGGELLDAVDVVGNAERTIEKVQSSDINNDG